ncbi:hypothetical protein Bbelb_272440 [Branchiostoma belcheri]|nr:hypothetical protein Bbelb_272440 [Branchiostoma belcheri]
MTPELGTVHCTQVWGRRLPDLERREILPWSDEKFCPGARRNPASERLESCLGAVRNGCGAVGIVSWSGEKLFAERLESCRGAVRNGCGAVGIVSWSGEKWVWNGEKWVWNGEKWVWNASSDGQGYSVSVFGASDYALLCRQWFGISGPCASMAKSQPDREAEAPARKRASLVHDYRALIEQGQGMLKNNYRNVTAPAIMFEIPIEQKLFHMLEAELHDLDVILASYLVKNILPDEDVDEAEVMHLLL